MCFSEIFGYSKIDEFFLDFLVLLFSYIRSLELPIFNYSLDSILDLDLIPLLLLTLWFCFFLLKLYALFLNLNLSGLPTFNEFSC